jgi:hypothetical protein
LRNCDAVQPPIAAPTLSEATMRRLERHPLSARTTRGNFTLTQKFQISTSNQLVVEGKATIRKRVAEVDEHYRVEFANKPGVIYQRFVDCWGQDDPEKYVQDFNRRAARKMA